MGRGGGVVPEEALDLEGKGEGLNLVAKPVDMRRFFHTNSKLFPPKSAREIHSGTGWELRRRKILVWRQGKEELLFFLPQKMIRH